MTTSQLQKSRAFRALHERAGAFIIPNPWDAGTAKILAALGFEALATTSLGRAAAEMIRLAAEAGVVGGSIEDATGNADKPIYDFELAVERVHAAVETARSLAFPFVLTARAENFMHGRRDLDDTIRRLQAFESAGADVLYAPGLRDLATIRTVASSVGKPLNVVAGFLEPGISAGELAQAGVKRISVGGGLCRLALARMIEGAREMKERGSFGWLADMVPTAELMKMFR